VNAAQRRIRANIARDQLQAAARQIDAIAPVGGINHTGFQMKGIAAGATLQVIAIGAKRLRLGEARDAVLRRVAAGAEVRCGI